MNGTDVTERIAGACTGRFSEVTMELVPRKEFFVQWRASGDSLAIRTSDYLSDARDAVLSDLAAAVCRRCSGVDVPLPQSFFDHVRSDGFIKANRPEYIRRSRNLTRSEKGSHCDLVDSVQRLMDSGLVTEGDISNSYFSWTSGMNVRRMGFCSTMFRVVGISSVMDDPDVPDSVRDYVVYHEILHLRQTFRIPHNAHDAQFRRWEHCYPGWREAEDYLPRFYYGNTIGRP